MGAIRGDTPLRFTMYMIVIVNGRLAELGGSVGVGVGESGGWVDGPRKSWWLFAGLSPGNMSGSVGM